MDLIDAVLVAGFGGMIGGTMAASDYGHASDGWYAIPIGVLFLAVVLWRRARS